MSKKVVIIFLSLFFVYGCSSKEDVTFQSITLEQLDEVNEGGIIIDVRTSNEFASGSIDGSINIPYDELELSMESIVSDKTTQIFVYCATGARSNEAANILVELGYTNVYDMGGLYS